MSTLALLSAILFGTISFYPVLPVEGVRESLAVAADDYVVVAVIPDCEESHEERDAVLRAAVSTLAEECGREVVLTEDLLSYLSLKRMEQRGVSDYERRALASRLYAARGNLFKSERGVVLTNSTERRPL